MDEYVDSSTDGQHTSSPANTGSLLDRQHASSPTKGQAPANGLQTSSPTDGQAPANGIMQGHPQMDCKQVHLKLGKQNQLNING